MRGHCAEKERSNQAALTLLEAEFEPPSRTRPREARARLGPPPIALCLLVHEAYLDHNTRLVLLHGRLARTTQDVFDCGPERPQDVHKLPALEAGLIGRGDSELPLTIARLAIVL